MLAGITGPEFSSRSESSQPARLRTMSVPDFIDKTSAGFSLIDVPETVRANAIENLESWLLDGRFENSIPQLDHLLQTGSYDQLFDAFFQHLPFGTSGRRGPVGFGSNRFNPFTLGT